MRNKLKLIPIILFIPCITSGQVNRFICFTKKFAPIYNTEINSIKNLYNPEKYLSIVNNYNKGNAECLVVGYTEDVCIDFFKLASKINDKTGVNYVLHFENDSGKTISIVIDTFIIPSSSVLIVSDIKGNILNKFNSNIKFRHVDNVSGILIFFPAESRKELILSINFLEEIPLREFKINICKIGVRIFDR
jgi:hypothetical protein